MKTVKKVSIGLKKAIEAAGVNIAMNNDPAAGQVIFHAHIHIVPRLEGDGFKHWPGTPYKEGEEAKIADKIKSELK